MFKITQRVINLVIALQEEGYSGTAEITNSYCTGTYAVLGNTASIRLSGFCKETLHIVENTEDNKIYLVGRYAIEYVNENCSVKDIVKIAMSMWKIYGRRGYSFPQEFRKLSEKYGTE